VALVPRNVLVLSGGGMNGAYTAGVLKGWTASGARPRLDVVTGISTGALIATFAFLGPQYDDALQRGYTTLRDGDIFRRRFPLALLWADSLVDDAPLRRHIEAEITPDILAQVARAHAEGRRLYIGTTDLDTRRQVIWDMGAIAAGDSPDKLDLFRKVVLASASVPGLFPPVPIDVEINGRYFTELHVDGGVTANLFLRSDMLGPPTSAGNTTVHVIVAGKLQTQPQAVKRGLLSISDGSLEGLLQSQFEGALLRVYFVSRNAGARFALAAVPENFPGSLDSLSFDPRVMQALFDEGFRSARASTAWRKAPPGVSPREQPPPRGGTRFDLATGR
jgi:predicted patatin/cPLA2 family phospholipase